MAGKKAIVLPYNTYLSDLYGNGIVASDATIADNPDLVRRFRSAMLKALVYTIAHPQEAAEILKRAQPASDLTAAVGEITSMTPYTGSETTIGNLDRERVAQAIVTLEENDLIDPGLTPEAIVAFDTATMIS